MRTRFNHCFRISLYFCQHCLLPFAHLYLVHEGEAPFCVDYGYFCNLFTICAHFQKKISECIKCYYVSVTYYFANFEEIILVVVPAF